MFDKNRVMQNLLLHQLSLFTGDVSNQGTLEEHLLYRNPRYCGRVPGENYKLH